MDCWCLQPSPLSLRILEVLPRTARDRESWRIETAAVLPQERRKLESPKNRTHRTPRNCRRWRLRNLRGQRRSEIRERRERNGRKSLIARNGTNVCTRRRIPGRGLCAGLDEKRPCVRKKSKSGASVRVDAAAGYGWARCGRGIGARSILFGRRFCLGWRFYLKWS